MNESSGAMNSQSMVKSGDQPRMQERDIRQEKAPPSMQYVRNMPRGATQRNNGYRSTSRG